MLGAGCRGCAGMTLECGDFGVFSTDGWCVDAIRCHGPSGITIAAYCGTLAGKQPLRCVPESAPPLVQTFHVGAAVDDEQE
jgi:hypothetical protein